MRFDVTHPDDLCDRYPELKRRGFEDDKLLRYCIVMTAPDSPFKDERDFSVKSNLCLDYINISEDEKARIKEMVRRDDEVYREYCYELFRFLNQIDYELWYSIKESLHILSARLRSPLLMKDSDRVRAMKELSEIAAELKQVEYRLFSEDHMKALIVDEATANSLGGFAEKFALESPSSTPG